jgi:hypothetical protein
MPHSWCSRTPTKKPTTNLNSEIRSKIEAFVEELIAHVKKVALESVHAVLGGVPASRSLGRSRTKVTLTRPAKPAMKGGKRTPEQVQADAERIASHVREHPGHASCRLRRGSARRRTTSSCRSSSCSARGRSRRRARSAGRCTSRAGVVARRRRRRSAHCEQLAFREARSDPLSGASGVKSAGSPFS